MTQYQDPEEKDDPELTPQVLKARQVLEELDEMRASGASTQAQFEFLRKKLPQNDDLEDDRTPIDVRLERQEEARAGFRRVQEAMTNLMATWDGSTVLSTEIKEVGGRLLNTVDQMRRQAEDEASKNWKSEVEMLAELWPSDPDVSGHFDCTPIRPPRAPALGKLWVKEKETVELPEEEAGVKEAIKSDDCERLEKLARGLHEKAIKEAAEKANEEAATKSRLEAQDLDKKWHEEARALEKPSARRFAIKKDEPVPTEKVVGSVHPPAPAPEAKKDEGPNHLRRDAWADALREMTALPWKFDRELHGRTGDQGLDGDVLHFMAPSTEIMSARLTIIPMPKGKQQVTLCLQMDGEGYHLTETLVEDEAEKLHLDPIPFVKKTLKK